ncbi:MAG: MerR family transcriptional regulator [Xanthomonadales bacterium]|nr:MerR family transcriptional regulator [Xanthomonadales bacterium]
MSQFLRIGQFADLCGVSVKTLRFYDAEGLLSPAHVNPDNGYRYYRVEQARQLNLVTNLRSAGFPIPEIAQLVSSPPRQRELLERASLHRRRLEQELREVGQQIQRLDSLLSSVLARSADPLSGVRLTSIAPIQAHVLASDPSHQDTNITEMFERAESTVAQFGARLDQPPFLMLDDADPDRRRVEVCIPVCPGAPETLPTRVVAGSELACSVVYAGAYRQTGSLRTRMGDWITNAGLKAQGPLREVYHRFGADQGDYRLPPRRMARSHHDFLTELLQPITT